MTSIIDDLVDAARYPLRERAARYRRLVSGVRAALAADGCCVLSDFVRAERRDALRAECAAVAPGAYFETRIVNVYNTAPDPTLPADHPAHVTMRRGNAFVARDRIPGTALVHRLYRSAAFQRFIADCFVRERLYQLADPLAGLTVNVVAPGREHPWHFDTNEFTVSLLTQEAGGGGVFEYCPGIRSRDEENLAAVREVLAGGGAHLVRRLTLRPGDLQLFTGRYSLHRVTAVAGPTARHTTIFAYSEHPGVVGTPERTRQLFGRVTPAHRAEASTSVDRLLI